MGNKRYIVHIDMDAFFAAIEQRDDASLRGKPVVVGADPKHGKGRGVVSTCSYEARRFGIRSAMPISEAYRRCPNAVFLPPDMEKYAKVSRGICDILYEFTPDVEPVSIDESFLDISSSHRLFGKCHPRETCMLIKSRIREHTGLTASVGLAPTKMAAKIASDLEKPDGMVEVKEEALLDFLRPLEVRRLWGLGEKTQKTLSGMGVWTIGDLAKADTRELERIFGKNGYRLWQLANGIDEERVEAQPAAAKSVSGEFTFDKDISDNEEAHACLIALCEKVSASLRRDEMASRTVTLKIRLEGFHTYTRSLSLRKPTNFADVLYKAAKGLYNNFDRQGSRIRLVGVRASNLASSAAEVTLFPDVDDEKKESLHAAVDRIRKRFGDGAIGRAAGRAGFDY